MVAKPWYCPKLVIVYEAIQNSMPAARPITIRVMVILVKRNKCPCFIILLQLLLRGEIKSWEMFVTNNLVKWTVKSTGEILEFDVTTPEDMIAAWVLASEYIKAYEKIKEKIKPLMAPHLGERDTYESNGYMYRKSTVQRMMFDKTIMRDVLDADTFDLFMKPDGAKFKVWLLENLDEMGEASTLLARGMVPDGKPYEVNKVERLTSKAKFDDET